MFRHKVNIALLLCFLVLAVTGIMAYFTAFSLTVARTHMLAALFMVGLSVWHVFDRLGYFKKLGQGLKAGRGPVSRKAILWICLIGAGLLVAAIANFFPAKTIVQQSYEARHSANIVRSSPLIGFLEKNNSTLISRKTPDDADYLISLHVNFKDELETRPSLVVWAETTTGAMIETLYVDEGLSYSDTPKWNGKPTPRHHIFPIWRNRYTLVSGVDPEGEFDAETGTTPSHTFSLSDYVNTKGASTFVIFAEVNQAGDVNNKYKDGHIGQPSVLYSALIRPGQGSPYSIMKLTGHGGGAQKSGAIQYDLENIGSAKALTDLLLLDVRRAND